MTVDRRVSGCLGGMASGRSPAYFFPRKGLRVFSYLYHFDVLRFVYCFLHLSALGRGETELNVL